MSYATQKAAQVEKKAESTLRSFLGLGKNKEREAAKLFVEAGDLYQEDDEFESAARVYISAVTCYLKLGQQLEAANTFGEAGDCFQKCRKYAEAAEAYEKSSKILAESGKFVKAAETLIELANVLEKQNKVKQAIPHMEKAINYYEADRKETTVKQLQERLALLNATAEYYDEAIEYWEERAKTIISATDGSESKLNAKKFLFKAGLCQLAQVKDWDDLEIAKDKIEEYIEMDRWLPKHAEGQFLKEAVSAFERKSIAHYQKAMQKYDNNNKDNLDHWTSNILDTIYSNMKSCMDEEFDLT